MGEIGKPLRVLQVVTNMDRGGLETMLMNYYRNIDRTRVQFDFLTHRQEKAAYDDEILSLGGKIYHLPRLVPWSSTYRKALDNFFKTHPAYSIVHVHQDCLSAVILKAAKLHGVPMRIAHSHSSSQDKNWKYPIKLFYKKFIPKYATALMACSRQAGDWMFNREVFSVFPNAINARIYKYDCLTKAGIRQSLLIRQNSLVPLLTSNIRGVSDYVFDGVTGYRCAPDDAAGFAKGLARYFADRKLCSQIGENNAGAAKKYDICKIEKDVCALMDFNEKL